MTFEPFTEDDLNSAGPTGSVYGRSRRKPTIAWDPDLGPENDMNVLKRGVEADDAREAARYLSEPGQPGKPRRFPRLSGPQFGNLEGLDDVRERMVSDPVGTKIPKASRLMDRPPEHTTPDNWQRGMGDTWTQRNFNPSVRAKGHLLGAGIMFAATMPPLAPRPNVTQIRY